MKTTLSTALVLLTLLAPQTSQAMTKCTDQNGKVTYQDGACPAGAASAGVAPAAAAPAPVLLSTKPGAVVINNRSGRQICYFVVENPGTVLVPICWERNRIDNGASRTREIDNPAGSKVTVRWWHQGDRIPGADDHYKPAGGVVNTVEATAQ